MTFFSSLLSFSVSDAEALATLLGCFPPPKDLPTLYKLPRVVKPAKGSVDQRWMILWWQYCQEEGKVIRRRQGFDLSSISQLKQREARAREWVEGIGKLLKKGLVYYSSGPPIPQVVSQTNLETLQTIFLTHVKQTLSQGSYDVHRSSLSLLGKWYKGQGYTSLSQLGPREGKDFEKYLSTFISKRGKPLSPKSRNNYLLNLKTFGNWLVEQGHCKKKAHPFRKVSKLKVGMGEKHQPYSQQQVATILEACQGTQLHTFLQFLYYTLARPGKEVRLLQVKDIRETTIHIPQGRDKNGKGRYCTISPPLEGIIQQQGYRSLPLDYYLFGLGGVPGLVPRGKKYFYEHLVKVLDSLGLKGKGYDLYGFKHTANIQLWLRTRDLLTVQRQNGHSTLLMTQTYLSRLGLVQDSTHIQDFPEMGKIPG